MFSGYYKHSLDSAGRFVMPFDIRLDLSSKPFYITKGVGCLCVFHEDYIKKIEEEFAALGSPLAKLLNPDIARLERHFFSGLAVTTTDKQFRTPLTPEQRRFAGIEDEVIIIGRGTYVELWSPAAYELYTKDNENAENLIASGTALMASLASMKDVGSDATVSPTGTN